MHSETPQKLPRKPGEPGGEKARLTEAERDQVLQLASNCWDRDWFPNSEDQQLLFDWIDRRVAGALAALEAEKPLLELIRDMVQEMKPGPGAGGNDYHDAWQVFGERLERAAEGKALGKPEVRAT